MRVHAARLFQAELFLALDTGAVAVEGACSGDKEAERVGMRAPQQ
jgi:hypothetical protein